MVLAFDEDGGLEWAGHYDTDDNKGHGIGVVDHLPSGDVIIGGRGTGTDLGTGPLPEAPSGSTLWIARLDQTDGDPVWIEHYNASSGPSGGHHHYGLDVSTDRLGSTGIFTASMVLGDTYFSNPNASPFGIALTDDGGVLLAGLWNGGYEFDPGGPQTPWELDEGQGFQDGFLIRYDEDSEYLWHMIQGGPGFDNTRQVAVAPSGDIILHGTFTGMMSLGGPPLTSAGGGTQFDLFVARLTPTGGRVWSQRFGGPHGDHSTHADALLVPPTGITLACLIREPEGFCTSMPQSPEPLERIFLQQLSP